MLSELNKFFKLIWQKKKMLWLNNKNKGLFPQRYSLTKQIPQQTIITNDSRTGDDILYDKPEHNDYYS